MASKKVEKLVFEVNEVKGCRPVGSQILLELLTAQEIMNTKLHLRNNKATNEYQAFVLACGPGITSESWGFKVGDRVLVSGSGVPVPNYDDSERDRVLMEPHSIKGVLT
jgi:co-chaperonin GroES (HSP10)